MSIRPRRSMLYMPGSNARALEKARGLDADGLILDLEDAVAPAAKEEARRLITRSVTERGFGYREVLVRVNGLDGPWGPGDVAAVARLPIDGVLFPKIGDAREVQAAIEALDGTDGGKGIAVWVMAETPHAILNAHEICAASSRLAGVVMGTSDLAKELRVPHTPDRAGLLTSLSTCVLAARANGLAVLDGVHLDLENSEEFRAHCEQGRDLGFDGKTLIHPRQIAPCNLVFSPDEEAVENAYNIIAAWEAAASEGRGVCIVNGRLVENLHVDEARRTLALFEATQRSA